MSTTLLFTHLQNIEPTVPLPTLLAALSHHLTIELPTPTPLAAAAVSSPFFLATPQTYEKLQGLVDAFRHAVYLIHQARVKRLKEGRGVAAAVFGKSVEGSVKERVLQILKGVQGGRAEIRLSCCVGLLLGARGLERLDVNVARKIEDEIIIALAEVMDTYTHTTNAGDWEKEFQPQRIDVYVSLCLILASQALPLIPATKLKALPLSLLASLLTSTISSAFRDGGFLETSPSDLAHTPPTSPFAQTIHAVSLSSTMMSMAGLSKLTAIVLGVLIDSPNGGLREASNTLDVYRQMARKIEKDWKGSVLSNIESDNGLASDTKNLAKSIWLLLKTLLFSTIMVADGALGGVVFVRPHAKRRGETSTITPHTLAQLTLHTLFHISFVVSQFGGVTATPAGGDPGFSELRKVFYLAIDVLSSEEAFLPGEIERKERDNASETFVKQLVNELAGTDAGPVGHTKRNATAFELARAAYALACVEQLVPLLRTECLRDYAWGLCVPYLSDSSHRETYESAHSVALAIFASHAQQQHSGGSLKFELPATSKLRQTERRYGPAREHESRRAGGKKNEDDQTVRKAETTTTTEHGTRDSAGFVRRIIPFYAQCLVQNSVDGKLSTAQLRLAYAALVRSASAGAVTSGPSPEGTYKLAWYCIELLLDAIRQIASIEHGAKRVQKTNNEEWLHRLHLTLISVVPSLPLPLMIRALEEIRNIITALPGLDGGVGVVRDSVGEERKRKELVEAVFAEISGRVGDGEKETAMRWWYANRPILVWGDVDEGVTFVRGKGMGKKMDFAGLESQSGSGIISRL